MAMIEIATGNLLEAHAEARAGGYASNLLHVPNHKPY